MAHVQLLIWNAQPAEMSFAPIDLITRSQPVMTIFFFFDGTTPKRYCLTRFHIADCGAKYSRVYKERQPEIKMLTLPSPPLESSRLLIRKIP